jgi:CO/xanthine dehydrogenase FAD-binding subunit
MSEINWYFPKRIEDVTDLLKIQDTVPHGGGTGIIRTGLNHVKGLIDLRHIPLQFFQQEGEYTEIGSTQTFAEVAEKIGSGHILAKALGSAASTPLRNRITIGGSIALFPTWSDLMGPLIALEAQISLEGARQGKFGLIDYISKPELSNGTIIKSVIIKNDTWASYYHRDVRLDFDYPTFTITILLKKANNKIEDIRIVVIGCAGKYSRLNQLEDSLKGKVFKDINIQDIGKYYNIKFTQKHFSSPEYLVHLADTGIKRGLFSLLRS